MGENGEISTSIPGSTDTHDASGSTPEQQMPAQINENLSTSSEIQLTADQKLEVNTIGANKTLASILQSELNRVEPQRSNERSSTVK